MFEESKEALVSRMLRVKDRVEANEIRVEAKGSHGRTSDDGKKGRNRLTN